MIRTVSCNAYHCVEHWELGAFFFPAQEAGFDHFPAGSVEAERLRRTFGIRAVEERNTLRLLVGQAKIPGPDTAFRGRLWLLPSPVLESNAVGDGSKFVFDSSGWMNYKKEPGVLRGVRKGQVRGPGMLQRDG